MLKVIAIAAIALLIVACGGVQAAENDVDLPGLSVDEVKAVVQDRMRGTASMIERPGGIEICYQTVQRLGGWESVSAAYMGEGAWLVNAGDSWQWVYYEKTGSLWSQHAKGSIAASSIC